MPELEIAPEPPPEERQAIAEALTRLAEPDRDPGPWWRAGLAENLEPELYATAFARRSPGASRA